MDELLKVWPVTRDGYLVLPDCMVWGKGQQDGHLVHSVQMLPGRKCVVHVWFGDTVVPTDVKLLYAIKENANA